MINKYILTPFLALAIAIPTKGEAMEPHQHEIQSYSKSIGLLLDKAVKGDLDAQKELGYAYQKGHRIPSNLPRALYWYEQAAQQGDVNAQYEVSNMYSKGIGTELNLSKALFWFEKAALQGNTEQQEEWEDLQKQINQITSLIPSQASLDILLEKAYRGDKESRDAVLQGIIKGTIFNSPQKINIARLFDLTLIDTFTDEEIHIIIDTGFYKKFSKPQIEILYLKTCTGYYLNSPLAAFNFAQMYALGIKVSFNPEMALKFYLNAGEKGSSLAQVFLGTMYIMGIEVPVDYNKAISWYKKAKKQNDLSALNNLGMMHFSGHGVPQNHEKAFKLYKKASDQGLYAAKVYLAEMYEKGYGVPQNLDKAFELCHEAANQGVPEAQNKLADMYERDHNASIDYNKVIEWRQKAANQKLPSALNNLGFMYEEGVHIPQNYKKAFELYQEAVNQGSSMAHYNLGRLYKDGHGTSTNYVKAFELLQTATDLGVTEALKHLANLYECGVGVSQSCKKAFELYQKSANAGDEEAQPRLEALKETINKMTEATIKHLKKDHNDKTNNHFKLYIQLLEFKELENKKAMQYIAKIQRSNPRTPMGKKTKKILQEVLMSAAPPPSTPAPVVNLADVTPSTETGRRKKRFAHSTQRKEVSRYDQPMVDIEPKTEPENVTETMSTTTATTTSTATATTTSTALAEKEALRLTPVTTDILIEPFIPSEPKGEKIKTKGIAGKKKKKDKEGKEKKKKWSLGSKKKKNKETIEQDDGLTEHKGSTQLALPTSNASENNKSFHLRKTIGNILRTSKKMLSLDESTIVKTLWGLHEAGEINLRNVVPTETSSFAISDNKIVATKAGDSLITMVVHTHGAWWEKPAIIKNFVRFLRALSDEDHREFQKAIYNIKKDKK